MNSAMPHTVGDVLLPTLIGLVQARKQARWQWAHQANEHQHKWVVVIDHLDIRIRLAEMRLATIMDMDAFRIKREIVE